MRTDIIKVTLLAVIYVTIDVSFHVESQGTVTLGVKYPPGLSTQNVSFEVTSSPVGDKLSIAMT